MNLNESILKAIEKDARVDIAELAVRLKKAGFELDTLPLTLEEFCAEIGKQIGGADPGSLRSVDDNPYLLVLRL